MVGTIIPMVHRAKQNEMNAAPLWSFAAGSVLGGTLLGGIFAGVGMIAARASGNRFGAARAQLLALVILSILYGLHELRLINVPALQFARQVPQSWTGRMSPTRCAFAFGFCLGGAIGTRIPMATFYVISLYAIFSGSVGMGILIMGLFGLSRALPVILLNSRIAVTKHREKEQAPFSAVVWRWATPVHLLNGLSLLFLSGYAGAAYLLTR
jgi:sulfite exporter TauE/SafE